MKFGITQAFSCSYLPDEHEQLLVFAGEEKLIAYRYAQLIQVGFRRSGEQIYRPHCPHCHACESIRVPVSQFVPSKSQKRILSRNKMIRTVLSSAPQPSYYPLYENYISTRHIDGSMYPPSEEQFESFITCSWQPPMFIEAYDDQQLIAVAVTDVIEDGFGHSGFSALYTFFNPAYADRSIGTFMILQQIKFAARLNKNWLYLGYQVDGCKKMNYKTRFLPHERFSEGKWCRIDKKSA
ncbi:arginyltransferase [Alteromonas ponticola]|uniref:Aspartate/glutamate leucyltransferase n=1 Tax=Alteromonas aquimaris TaxID=2998417 RepID=A0ABT3P7B8_9ALTE|nr:arginyltransferase [Alteromonas aquimaris]MCW8108663.1 arginyltransferase [Alteromonas aquimaris]